MHAASIFLNPELAREIAARFGTPAFVYDETTLRNAATEALAFPNAFGLTVRYAMKAASNAALLRLFNSMGLHIDASSVFEVERAIAAGIPPAQISLSAQELDDRFAEFAKSGVHFNACSLAQLERFARMNVGRECGIRFNPGLGSGSTGKTNVGGPHSSFGIWHEWKAEVRRIATEHGIRITRIHTHIGSGSDPEVWSRAAGLSLSLVRDFETVHTLNLGGGYKVARMPDEVAADLAVIGQPVKTAFLQLAAETGRQIHLEIEPGTFLVANGGALLCRIHDIVQTGGPDAMRFYKTDSGMTEVLRPSLYGAQHPITVVPATPTGETENAMVVGHNCESGDILTCAPGDPEALQPRQLAKATIGDLCVIDGAGAYCSTMSAKNYNSFPEAPEVLVDVSGIPRLIRMRQTLDQIIQNEVRP